MNNWLDIDQLKKIEHTTSSKLNNLKDSWNDNDQKEFDNDKVKELDTFMKNTIHKFSEIDDDFVELDLLLEKI